MVGMLKHAIIRTVYRYVSCILVGMFSGGMFTKDSNNDDGQ